jgi:Recombination endonuclease VII
MLAAQSGLCAICREAPAEHVDHDHATNRVRGLLCFNCNGALGQFRDRTDLMLRAVAYLGHGDAETAADLPTFHFGVFVGELAEPGPQGYPEDDAEDDAEDDPAAA